MQRMKGLNMVTWSQESNKYSSCSFFRYTSLHIYTTLI